MRWTDPATGRRRAEEFDTIKDAENFRARLRVARARDEVADLTRGDRTLDDFVEREWWPKYAGRQLERNTLRPYASVYNRHLAPRIGHVPLRQLTAPMVRDLREELLDDEVGAPTVRRALVILQGICSYAVEAGEMAGNPVREVKKPPVTRHLAIAPPSPDQIEALRAELDPISATLVSVLAYEGCRPEEALAGEERHVGETTLLIEQRNIDGQLVPGVKTSRRRARGHRSPTLYTAVREDLAELTGHVNRRGHRRLLFPDDNGSPWTAREYRDWREDVFHPAVRRAGLTITRPYDLRHACASLMLHAHRPLTEIAEHLGHSVATLSDYYAHVIADLRGTDPIPVEEQIAAARVRRARR